MFFWLVDWLFLRQGLAGIAQAGLKLLGLSGSTTSASLTGIIGVYCLSSSE
jgi:hypothetical protein